MVSARIARWRQERAFRTLSSSDHLLLRGYAAADWPDPAAPAREAPFLALDFELDGLRKDAHLLQAGWVPFTGRSIAMAGARSIDIRSYAQLDDEAVTIHGIGEQRAAQGEPVAKVIAALIEAMAGRVMVAHAAGIERSSLQRMAQKLFGEALPIRQVCTLSLERRINPNCIGPEAYRLASCRKRYGLPEYQAHDALTDAIAAAELFQAQLTRLSPATTLGDLEHG